MKSYLKFCDALVRIIEYFSGLLLVLMSASTCWQVISRRVLHKSSVWTQDLSLFLFVWVVMLGSAAAAYGGKHISVTLIVEHFPKPLRLFFEYFALLCVAGCSILLMTTGWTYFLQNIGSKSSGLVVSLGLPTFALPLGGGLMFIMTVGAIIKRIVKGKENKA